jgi:hypothetical protein
MATFRPKEIIRMVNEMDCGLVIEETENLIGGLSIQRV